MTYRDDRIEFIQRDPLLFPTPSAGKGLDMSPASELFAVFPACDRNGIEEVG